MLTPDIKPNRLTRAKLAINDMARQLDGDGIGIVAFAGSAFLVCPLTLDYGAFQQSLDAVDVHTIPLGGTNISSAIQAARAALRRRPGSDKILILVTDGENLERDASTAAEQAAQQDGLKIYTVGIGTAEGDLIPLPSDLGSDFVKDDTGALVKSHLDEGGLKAIASATGGAYVHLEGQGEDFEAFLKTVFGAVAKHDLVYRQQKIYTQRYQWPLAACLGLLLASLVMGTRRSSRRRTAAVSRAVATLTVMGVLVIPMRSESADRTNPPGATADAKTPLAQYNVGTSAYRAGKFPQATQAFQKSIEAAPASDARRLSDQQDAYYNLGNTLYRAGQQLEKSAPQEAIPKMDRCGQGIRDGVAACAVMTPIANTTATSSSAGLTRSGSRPIRVGVEAGARVEAVAKVAAMVRARVRAAVRGRDNLRRRGSRPGRRRKTRRTTHPRPRQISMAVRLRTPQRQRRIDLRPIRLRGRRRGHRGLRHRLPLRPMKATVMMKSTRQTISARPGK